MSEPQRLSKRLMELAQCSRREAELYIEGGWVSVDGEVIEQPQWKVQDEKVELHPDADLTSAAPVTLVVNCPAMERAPDINSVDAASRWDGDAAPVRVLSCHLRRLQAALPLARGEQGMQVLTQDLGLARYLSSVQANIEQEFVVEVQGELSADQLASLNHGLSFNGRPLRPAKVSWQSEARLRFALKNPQPGQIANMCEQVGLQVKQIKRIRIGAIPLRKMPLNAWRYLPGDTRF